MKTLQIQKTIFKSCMTLVLVAVPTHAQQQSQSSAINQLATQLSTNLLGSLACSDSREQVFNAYYEAIEKLKTTATIPNAGPLAPLLQPLATLPIAGATEIFAQLSQIHQIFAADLGKLISSATDPEEKTRGQELQMARLEMRSKIRPEYQWLNTKLDLLLTEAKIKAKLFSHPCKKKPLAQAATESGSANAVAMSFQTSSQNVDSQNVNSQNIEPQLLQTSVATPSISGDALASALFTMGIAYQSCQALDLPPLNVSTEDTQGVAKSQMVDDVGWGRKYTDLNLLKQTHYYLRGQTYSDPCLNQDAKPLVYDYGGVPVIKSSTELNLFSNSGGGPALGIDCSAFVSTAVSVAGHRFNPSTNNKPQYTRFVSADYIDPTQSGWGCYANVKMGPDAYIQPGDIASVRGHVVMVDQVGDDPFGLRYIQKIEDCAQLSSRNFDFTVIQSSPSKNSVGINRYIAKDYLEESAKMKTMFVAYGKAACKSQFDKTLRNPKTSDYGIIRHKTTANCQGPSINMTGAACINACAAN